MSKSATSPIASPSATSAPSDRDPARPRAAAARRQQQPDGERQPEQDLVSISRLMRHHQEVEAEAGEAGDQQQRVGADEARLRAAHDRAGAADGAGRRRSTSPWTTTRSNTALAKRPIAITGR